MFYVYALLGWVVISVVAGMIIGHYMKYCSRFDGGRHD